MRLMYENPIGKKQQTSVTAFIAALLLLSRLKVCILFEKSMNILQAKKIFIPF
ncbi:MAG: hypothetical protein ABF717_11045 [Lentilactobacillus hilgardii]